MDEAIDYNALSWVRQELEETLKLARVQLEEYAAGADNKMFLQKCAAQLHEALGPLQMVGIKGAVLLVTEMEEVVADLNQDSLPEKETALELLMQAFLQLPDYLSGIRAGRSDNPAVLLPVINSLRATRDVQPLQETAIFSPNLSVRVPVSVFDVRAKKEQQDIPSMARAARVRFQGGLLAWYRSSDGNEGLQALLDVLVHLQERAFSEPVARVWWIGAGVAEALRDGVLEETTEIKQLFGQLDRQIKRLLDTGERVFSDLLTDDLVKNLLYRVSQCSSSSSRIEAIKSTYDLKDVPANSDVDGMAGESVMVFNNDLLQTVAVTVRSDIEKIKELLDSYIRSDDANVQELAPIADGLHMLSNTLDMISKETLSRAIGEHEQCVRELVSGGSDPAEPVFSAIANTLIAVEDALDHVTVDDAENAALNQGIEAVSREVIASMSRAKEAINDFLKAPEDFDRLGSVPGLLEQMSGGLRLIHEERAATVTEKVKLFVMLELVESHKNLTVDQLDTLADAICSIEFHVEETCENRGNTGAALGIAEMSVKKLGYPCPVADYPANEDTPEVDQSDDRSGEVAVSGAAAGKTEASVVSVAPKVLDISPDVVAMQVIAADVDEEILAIFIEEADEELVKLKALVPSWVNCPDLKDYLVDVQRSFHTLKGSGRMVGALAVGEFAWAFENLVNEIMDDVVTPHDDIRALIERSLDALSVLIEQVKGNLVEGGPDINYLAHCALVYSDPDGFPEPPVVDHDAMPDAAPAGTDTGDAVTVEDIQPEVSGISEVNEDVIAEVAIEVPEVEAVEATQDASADLPVLSADADPEIVEIFLEEAAEEIASLSVSVPEWVNQPDNGEALITIRRSMHTLKGSGRMAGALLVGEFAWSIEELLNRVIDEVIKPTGPVFSLLEQVPEVIAQLIAQVQDGAFPAVDFKTIMQHADALGRGELPEVEAPDAGETATVDVPPVNDVAGQDDVADDDVEAELIDIFRTECLGHMQAIEEYVAAGNEPRAVSESLYRAFHTLSGISESANVVSLRNLAADLNNYMDAAYHSQQVLEVEALEVLKDCSSELRQLIDKLPDQNFDEALQEKLRERIAVLPGVDEKSGPETDTEDEHDVDGQQVAEVAETTDAGPATEDPYAEMDPELYGIFIEEASEIIDTSESVLRAWSEDRDNSDYRTEFQRHLHTLKGSARMMDITAIGDLAHVLESLIVRVIDGLVDTSDELFTLLQESHDRLSEMLENVKSRRLPGDAGSLETALQAMTPGEAGDADTGDEQTAIVTEDTSVPVAEVADVLQPVEATTETPEDTAAPRKATVLPGKTRRRKAEKVHSEQVRVQSELLDDLVNHSGEISIYRTRMEKQVGDFRFNLSELDQTITRLRNQLRQLEMETEAQILFRYEQEADTSNQDFDPLEMDRYSNLQQTSRSLIESISDLRSLEKLMEGTTREAETLLLQQSRVSTDLQEGLMRTRMIPFASLGSRLRRIVRQSARQLDKKVELDMVGADGEMDRTVIERIIAPLEHMLRNAIAHGIELPAQRKEAGKQVAGAIRISFDREGPEIVLRIEDDGAGIDVEAVRAGAVARGLLQEDSKLPDVDIMQFILQTGFSTATEVTQISGRGVGMDVVNSEVKQLGGSLHIESTPGLGTLFTVRLPYTLAINQALLVTAGEQAFCVPLGSVEGVVRANPEELMRIYSTEDCAYGYAGNDYQLRHLGTVLETGQMDLSKSQGQVPVLLVRIGEKRVAFQVESLRGSREIVIKPVGAQLSTVDSVSGATILGDGSVVMILDVAAIARINTRVRPIDLPTKTATENRLLVMVVDDSITVRKVTTRLLERKGFMVLTAKDGVDAMGQLQDTVPDMMLLDIEMPRMDGFELATHMRNDERFKRIPIIMITSRTGEKHRERARQIGVDNYLGKPYQEKDLLESIHQILGVSEAGEVA